MEGLHRGRLRIHTRRPIPSILGTGIPTQGVLVGGSTHLNNMKVSWDDYSQYMEK